MPKRKETTYYLPYPLFDSHFHALVMKERDLEAADLLQRAFSEGLIGAIDVAVDESDFSKRVDFAKKFAGIRLSAGIHPSYTYADLGNWQSRFDTVREQVSDPSVVAIGETGLDFYRDHSPRDVQEAAFRDHLELASETGKPIIVHNRNADERVLAVIGESGCRFGVFHCFSSGWETAKKALDFGFCISFAGNLTYKGADEMRYAASKIPADRILVETDAPFLSPHPVRGHLNHPGHIGLTLTALAEIRGVDPEDLAAITVENSLTFAAVG